MRHLRRFPFLALCAVMLAALLGAACSDDGDDAAGDSSSTETTAKASDDSPETTGDEAGATEPAAGDQEVAIANYTFEPEAITVKAGSLVTWTNDDDFDHTATSTDGPAEFDTGDLGKGAAGEVTFDTPGTYQYQCDIHAYMTGTVEVVE